MCLRVTRRLTTIITTNPASRPLAHISKQSQLCFASNFNKPSRRLQHEHSRIYSASRYPKQSGTGTLTVVLLVGIAIGGVLLFPREQHIAVKGDLEKDTYQASEQPDTLSYLSMAPQMPPGRPGTLTPEQEVKLRELWALTMKVFGVYEPAPSEPNGIASPKSPGTDLKEAGDKKEKKKSRLRVFSRNKTDKAGDSETPTTPGTPADISQLSLADDDDKHGLNKDFKAALANLSPEDLRKAFWGMVKHDHPDGLLLRFLRARKWDVDKALIMMISTMHWRMADMHVDDDIIRRGELAMLEESKSSDPKLKKEGDDFLAQMRMGKSYLHGVDKEGRPLCIVRVRLHRAGEQSEESLERFTVYTIETARMLLRPPVDTATIIFDMTNFSMSNMDYTPVKFMIKCFEANYPESLGAVLVHKAPWIFQGIWSIIRGWLDPVVAGKVHFTKNDTELENYIPRSQIPTELGGDEKWSYSYVEPDPSENAIQADTETRDHLLSTRSDLVHKYENVVMDWIHSAERKDGEKAKPADEVRSERDAIWEELKKNYWALDPYLRAKTLYDRTGMIGEGGKLDFYPPATKVQETKAATANAASPVQAKPEVETNADDVD